MNDRTFVVVGSLTRDAPYFQGARGKGITVFAFDVQTGQLTRLAEKGGVDNPTYLSVHEGNRCVYANSEVFGWNEGTVSAYRLDPTTGSLSYLNKQPALGSILAHNSLDRSGRFVLVANYSVYAEPEDSLPDQAVVVMPIRQDGALGAADQQPFSFGQRPQRRPTGAVACPLRLRESGQSSRSRRRSRDRPACRLSFRCGDRRPFAGPDVVQHEVGSGTPALRLPPLEPLCLRDQ